jgi:CBS domain-containing membrane protein
MVATRRAVPTALRAGSSYREERPESAAIGVRFATAAATPTSGASLAFETERDEKSSMPTTPVKEIMAEIVETLSVGDTLAVARTRMERGRIRHIPIVDGEERVVGLITHRQILEAWVSHGHPNEENPEVVARDVPIEMLMEKNVETVTPDTPAAHAAHLLETRKFGCLPVTRQGKLVGIVTESDFVHFARRYFEWEMRGDTETARVGVRRSRKASTKRAKALATKKRSSATPRRKKPNRP